MTAQSEKAARFAALHTQPGAFVIPNPWDVGSARILAGLGFEALATTSSGFANSLGLLDYEIPRDVKLAHIRTLAAAVDLPISADLENGFGDDPATVAETIRLGAEAGLVGGSIEDSKRDGGEPLYDIGLAKERIVAAVEAARALPFPFTLTARAENFFAGRPDLDDTIQRLQAYQEAGADVLYAPALQTEEDIKAVLSSVDRPLNVFLGPMKGFVSAKELEAMGVKRISVGSVLSTAAYGALIEAGLAMRDEGRFDFALKRVKPSVKELLAKGTPA